MTYNTEKLFNLFYATSEEEIRGLHKYFFLNYLKNNDVFINQDGKDINGFIVYKKDVNSLRIIQACYKDSNKKIFFKDLFKILDNKKYIYCGTSIFNKRMISFFKKTGFVLLNQNGLQLNYKLNRKFKKGKLNG